jgi:hypothetical protein
MTASDSHSRLWLVTRDRCGNPELTPVGHDTDPDSDDLSLADEEALMALLPDEDDDDDDEPVDRVGIAADRNRQVEKEARTAARFGG